MDDRYLAAEFDPRLLPTIGRATGVLAKTFFTLMAWVVCCAAEVGGLLYLCHLLVGWPP